jgi:CheY-like chemotaxis protein
MTAGAKTVLVVDDEYASLEVLALLLKGEGFQVLTAADGVDALERLRQHAIDLVITDYKMPRMDGSELCERMLADERHRRIPVIFTSATYRQDVPRPSNVVAFYTKPLLFKTLLAAAAEIMRQKSPP